jgi:GH3 auxin-responsive promoter
MSFAGNVLLRVMGPRAVKRFDDLSRAPAQSQQRLLRQILASNADTEFGRRHGFAAIATFQDYQERVPICGYDDLEPYINAEMLGRSNQLTRHTPVLFTTTSGTTGASKYIPVTREGKRAKSRLMWLWLSALYRDTPGSSVAGCSAWSAPRSSRTPRAASRAVRSPGMPTAPCPDR